MNDTEKHLKVLILDPAKLIKNNNLKEITNPIYFGPNGLPSPDGLLSNEIFGLSRVERSNIFAYIDLYKYFIDPLSYKIWSRLDRNIKECVHGTCKFIINSKGQLEKNESGDSGIDFLRNNMDKIKFRHTDSVKRDINIEFLEKNRDNGVLFLNKYIVIPAFYRDVDSSKKSMGVGDINKLYNKLLISVKALKDIEEFGFFMTGATIGRIQETLVDIYNWFTMEPNLGKKNGIIRRANMAKTADKASRLVISCPNLNVESMDDMIVDVKHCGLPLASAIANLDPYIVFWIRRFFENEFSGTAEKVMYDDEGKAQKVFVKDPNIQFSDDVIRKYMKRFIKGYSNRFIPIEVELTNGEKRFMHFKGRNSDVEENQKDIEDASSIYNRRLTWCDLFYMAAVEMSKDKHILMTRYPLNDWFGQCPNKIRILSTTETIPAYINNEFYPWYPKIREEDIGSNTSNRFVDTLNICNANIGVQGGDYDGDQELAKVVYTVEANKEIEDLLNSNKFYVDLGGKLVKNCGKESIQSIYNLTYIHKESKDKLTEMVF